MTRFLQVILRQAQDDKVLAVLAARQVPRACPWVSTPSLKDVKEDENNIEKLRKFERAKSTAKRLSVLNRQIHAIQGSKMLSEGDKERRVEPLEARKDRLIKQWKGVK